MWPASGATVSTEPCTWSAIRRAWDGGRQHVAGAHQDVGGDVVEHLERLGPVVPHEVLVEADHGVSGRADQPVDGEGRVGEPQRPTEHEATHQQSLDDRGTTPGPPRQRARPQGEHPRDLGTQQRTGVGHAESHRVELAGRGGDEGGSHHPLEEVGPGRAQLHQRHAADRVTGEDERTGGGQLVDQVGPVAGEVLDGGAVPLDRVGVAVAAMVPGDDPDPVPELLLQVAHLVVPALLVQGPAVGQEHRQRRVLGPVGRDAEVEPVMGLHRSSSSASSRVCPIAASRASSGAGQLRLASSGRVASIDRGGGWRRSTSPQTPVGGAAEQVVVRRGYDVPAALGDLALELVGTPARVADVDPERGQPAQEVVRRGVEVDDPE